MSQPLETSEITVQIMHQPDLMGDGGVSVAGLIWPEGRAIETYTIALGSFVSFELDKHLPIRPDTVKLYDAGAEEAEKVLEMYLGVQMTRALREAPKLGVLALTTRLNPDNRLAIATLQLSNPSTPKALKQVCEGLIDEQTRVKRSGQDRLAS